MSQINVKTVSYATFSGQHNTLSLRSDLACGGGVSPVVLCHLALPRLPISPSACMLLGLVIDERIAGLPVRHTYDDLGRILGRGRHTAVRAAAELRSLGLVMTTRCGARSAEMLFVCDPLIRWADGLLAGDSRQDVREESAEPSACPAAPVAAAAAIPEAPSGAFADTIMDDRPDWPAVPGDWRARYGVSMPQDDACPSMAIPLGVKPWLGPIPRIPGGGFDMDRLVRMPWQLVIDDDVAFHAYCQAKGDAPSDVPAEMKLDDPPVDASEEREAERRLSGQQDDGGDDEFRFDSGTDTAETDIGRGVRVNPDL